LVEIALDCIGKLISYSYFSTPSSLEVATNADSQRAPLIERAIDTICDCFQGEATPVEVQQQIVKSLLGAVLNDKIVVHGAGLLTAIRQIYNIFIYSKSSQNQQVAQGSLTQMVGTVFERVKTRLALKEARMNLSYLASDKGTENGSEINLDDSSSGADPTYGNGSIEVNGTLETASTAASGLSSERTEKACSKVLSILRALMTLASMTMRPLWSRD
jgi:brefeldin A-inhibited guanine nucleotide-exchange protein